MIQVPKLLNAIKDRVRIWRFYNSYSNERTAKRQASKLYVKETGVTVKNTKKGHYIVLSWHPKREPEGNKYD